MMTQLKEHRGEPRGAAGAGGIKKKKKKK